MINTDHSGHEVKKFETVMHECVREDVESALESISQIHVTLMSMKKSVDENVTDIGFSDNLSKRISSIINDIELAGEKLQQFDSLSQMEEEDFSKKDNVVFLFKKDN